MSRQAAEKKIISMPLISDNQSPEVLKPSEKPLDFPAALIPPQLSAILSFWLGAVAAARRNRLNALLFRIYNKGKDDLTKNDHFRSMLQTACQRRFQPEFVLFDSWYASLENLKLIRSFSWQCLTRLEHNRHVNPDRTKNIPIHQVDIPQAGCLVHLNIQDRDIEYLASSDLSYQ